MFLEVTCGNQKKIRSRLVQVRAGAQSPGEPISRFSINLYRSQTTSSICITRIWLRERTSPLIIDLKGWKKKRGVGGGGVCVLCFALQDGLGENPVLISNMLPRRSLPTRSETGLADPSWNKDIILILCSPEPLAQKPADCYHGNCKIVMVEPLSLYFIAVAGKNDSRVLSVTHAQALGNGPLWQAARNDSIILYILRLFMGAFHFIHPRHHFSYICK